jgi:hypothetical protein
MSFDGLSGVATHSCAGAVINGEPAYSLGVGPYTRAAVATDLAGNTAANVVSFSVRSGLE